MDYDCRRSPGYAQDRCLSRDGRGSGCEYGRRGRRDLLGGLEGGFQLLPGHEHVFIGRVQLAADYASGVKSRDTV